MSAEGNRLTYQVFAERVRRLSRFVSSIPEQTRRRFDYFADPPLRRPVSPCVAWTAVNAIV